MKFKTKIFITCGHWKSQGTYSKSRVPAPASWTHFTGNKSILGLFWVTPCVRALQAASAPHCSLTDAASREWSQTGDAPLSMGLVNLIQLVKKTYFCLDVHCVPITTKISSSAGRKGSPVLSSSLKKLEFKFKKYFTVAPLNWWTSRKVDFLDTDSFYNF